MELAQHVEVKLKGCVGSRTQNRPTPEWQNPRMSSNNAAAKETLLEQPRDSGKKVNRDAEFQESRAKGLCYHYNERWSPLHCCKSWELNEMVALSNDSDSSNNDEFHRFPP